MRQRLLNSAISLARPTPCRAHRVTCQLHYQLLCQAPRQPQLRPFTSTIAAHKKAHKSSKHDADQEITATPTSNPAQASKSPIDDPSDFTDLDAGIGQALERLTANLSKLRAGGRFNHELVEELRVKLDKNKSDTERLGDLAQVIPKTGRVLVVMVAEESVSYPPSSSSLLRLSTKY